MHKKTIIITGASKGIGKAIAQKLGAEGHNLLLCAQNEAELKETIAQLPTNSTYAYVTANLSTPEAAPIIIDACIMNFGGIDVLINNAGIANGFSVENTSIEQWDLMMQVNARAPFLLCKQALPYLKQSEQASVINISSVVGHKGYVNQAAYSASKHALEGFTKALAREVQSQGIRVHLIAPGGVATEMVAKTRPDLDIQGLITVNEIADIVAFLLNQRGNAVIDQINIRRVGNIAFD